MTVNPDEKMNRETQQEDLEEVKENSHSPQLSPLVFSKPHKKSSPPPPHDEEIFHDNEFRLTPPDDRTIHHVESPLPPPPAAESKAQDGVSGPVEGQEEGKRSMKPYLSILKRARRDSLMKRALLGLRISGLLFCLISFSVMAADKNKGWALDSFDRYKEFRYILAVNVIGFVYSGLQTSDLVYFFIRGKHVVQHHLRHYFNFLMDQILTYLVMSASSSAASRVEDWESNWGKDKFPDMAKASVAFSFLAFVAFASSSLISGYTLCTLKSM